METELDQMQELGSHLVSAHRLYLVLVQRAAQRDASRLRMARHRTAAPTTHECQDGPLHTDRLTG